MAHRPEDIRNVALIGHSGSGKTALVDALAHKTKVSSRHGSTTDGSSISDTEPEEKERKQTLTSHLFSLSLEKGRLNLIDTPGHPDFLADAYGTMPVVEAAILCISANGGLSFHARRLYGEAGKAGIGRAIVVTHPDGENADFDSLVAQLIEVFGDAVVPVTYPNGLGADFQGVHEVLAGEGPQAEEYREKLQDRVAEVDDELMAAYLESGEMSPEELEKNLPLAIASGKIVPLFTVAPPKELGLNRLLYFIQHYFPSPVSYGARAAATPGSDSYDQLVEPDVAQPFLGVVFKLLLDPYVGKMCFVRCLRGSLKSEEGVDVLRSGKHEKLSALICFEGAEHKQVDRVVCGDLFIITKVDDLQIGDSVSAEGAGLALKPTAFPMPAYSLAVNPASRGDEQKINQGLEKLASEDPTFTTGRDSGTGEHLISGMSPLHLEVQLGRLKRRFGVGTVQHIPSIPYKESVTQKAEGHHRHKKQSGGRGQFAEVYLRIIPLDRGQGFEFKDAVVGGSIPRQFIPEAHKGIKKFMEKGGRAGCEVVDVQAELYDGKFHDVDSDQLSFQLAGERAFAEAFAKAKPILLEPVMEVEIEVPDRFTGDVASNLSTQRGRMLGMETKDGIQIIRATVPMKEMQEYSTQLRSMTAGEGSFTMKASHLDPVPANLAQEIITAHKKALEAR